MQSVTSRITPTIPGIIAALILAAGIVSAQPLPHHRRSPVVHSKPAGLQMTTQRALEASKRGATPTIEWGPVIKISDDPVDTMYSAAGSYRPQLAAQGDTLHCTFLGANELLPYLRSTDGGLSWEPQRELLDTTIFLSCPHSWDVIAADSDRVAIVFAMALCAGAVGRVYAIESTDRGSSWSTPVPATTDTTYFMISGSMLGDTIVAIYSPVINHVSQICRLARTVDGGNTWTKNPMDMPSGYGNELRAALTPGLLNIFGPGDWWPGPAPEVVLYRSTDLANTWKDSVVLSPIDGNGSDYHEVTSYTHPGTGDPAQRTTIGVMWRGEEFTGAGFSAGMALRLSYDNGTTWGPVQIVSDTPRGTFHDIEILGNIVATSWSFDYGDFGPHEVRARVSFDCGQSWDAVFNLTPGSENAGNPSVTVTKGAVHVAWSQYLDGRWNLYYRRGELIQSPPPLSADQLSFDTVTVGCTGWQTVTVKNDRCNPLDLHAMVSSELEYTVDPPSVLISPGDSVFLLIRFDPLTVGPKAAHLLLSHNQGPQPDTVTLSGFATGSGGETAISQSYAPGWALVSLPVMPPCPYLLPGSFRYAGSYLKGDTLSVGQGYWQKLKSSDLGFAGAPLDSLSVNLAPRWNLIGSISTAVAVSEITSDPPGVVVSNFFGYDGVTYFAADSIEPGRAYWVKATEAATLSMFPSGPVLAGAQVRVVDRGELPPPPPNDFRGERLVVRPPSSTIPSRFVLAQNYPNPFNPTTEISFELPEFTHVSLEVFNPLGIKVGTLVDETRPAGRYSQQWNASGLPSGVYFYRLRAGGSQSMSRMVLMK